MNDSFFRKIESKTGVPMEEVFALQMQSNTRISAMNGK